MIRLTNKILLGIAVITACGYTGSKTEYDYFLRSISQVWEAETLYIGAQVVAEENGSEGVSVIIKKGHPMLEGTLYLMKPGEHNEAIRIATNGKENYGDTVKLGVYDPDTPLFFMYVITDTTKKYAPLRGKKLYSGRNIQSVDEYVSEANGVHEKKFAAAGMVDEKTVDIGFDASRMRAFLDIVFTVKGAKIRF